MLRSSYSHSIKLKWVVPSSIVNSWSDFSRVRVREIRCLKPPLWMFLLEITRILPLFAIYHSYSHLLSWNTCKTLRLISQAQTSEFAKFWYFETNCNLYLLMRKYGYICKLRIRTYESHYHMLERLQLQYKMEFFSGPASLVQSWN